MPNANVYDSRDYAADASPHVECVHDIDGPNPYVANGVDPAIKAALELADEPFYLVGEEKNGTGHTYRYDFANKKGIIRTAAGVEVAAADQSALKFRLHIKAPKSA